jgi:hypothetical protein
MVASRKTINEALDAMFMWSEIEGIERDKLGLLLASLCDVRGNASWYWTTRQMMAEYNSRIGREIAQQKPGVHRDG